MCSEQFKTPAKWSILELQTLGEGKAILNKVCVWTLYSLPKINFRDKPDWIKREIVPKVYVPLEKITSCLRNLTRLFWFLQLRVPFEVVWSTKIVSSLRFLVPVSFICRYLQEHLAQSRH